MHKANSCSQSRGQNAEQCSDMMHIESEAILFWTFFLSISVDVVVGFS